jgi:DNA-binding beta-propeller fold protein YncE
LENKNMNNLNFSRNLAVRTRAGCFPILIVLAGLLAMAPPLRADNPPTYLFEIDSTPASGVGFYTFDVALESDNNIYVTELTPYLSVPDIERIEKFNGSGTHLTQWGSLGTNNGQFEGASGVAVDSGNNLYVADAGNNRVQKFSASGTYLTQWGSLGTNNGQFDYPQGVAVDGSNNVYVADQDNSRVEKFDSNGNYLTQWGSLGTNNGQFDYPNGIAVDSSNNVYVVDCYNQRVEKFTSNGAYMTQWGSFGISNGQFGFPAYIAVDRSNNVYVTDQDNFRVEKFSSNGTYLTQWGSLGTNNGEFYFPCGVAVDSSGNLVYVGDSFNMRIEVFVNNANIPSITNQPVSQIIPGGINSNVTLTVGVFCALPFTCQWTFNNVAVPGATNATFTLTNASPSDSGTYSVLVANSYGSTSCSAVLTVLPALVTTQPASGLSAAGAVLNGSVTLGSEETVVWFDWGTDTNYGNIAGETIVPGNSSSNNISTVLNGLPGNVYHYRLNAANDFGIVYGNDQPFTVGFVPTATTLAALNSPNGSTLNATVNPNGWDTTVYFRWGTSISFLTNSTPVMDVGAGAVPLNVSSFINGLTPFYQYYYEAVASNYLGTVYGTLVAFYSPPFVTVPGEDWTSVASSADGSVMVAVANPGTTPPGGPIYISTNSGAVWNQATNAPSGRWESVACSADGSKIIAAEGGEGGGILGPIYTSTNTGMTWMSNNAPVTGWQSVASSADGTKLVAADLSARKIYTSTNSGATWVQASNVPRLGWYSVASSADGSKLAAVAGYAYYPSPGASNIYTSTNFGATWITNTVPATPFGIQNNWAAIASSADGSKLIAAGGGYGSVGYIFLSTNFGASWALTATNILPYHGRSEWIYVASSADGSKLAAVSESGLPGGVITSTDSGATWITNSVPNLTWNAVALSADGARMVVTVGYPSYVGRIYTTQTTPSPVLNLSASDNVISWIIPSLDFTLQQSPDLTSWTDVTNLPVLNLTNLEDQVVLPPPAGNSFFRLLH